MLITGLSDKELRYIQAVLESGIDAFGYDHAEVEIAEDITSAIERRLT